MSQQLKSLAWRSFLISRTKLFKYYMIDSIRTQQKSYFNRSYKVYRPNRVMIWTDTFANNRQSDIFSTTLGEKYNARLAELNRQDIRVIVGNPPYSVGQESQNDDNQKRALRRAGCTADGNLRGPHLIPPLKEKLYDSYIRAYRWASDRIGKKGNYRLCDQRRLARNQQCGWHA